MNGKAIRGIAEETDRSDVRMPWYVIQTYTGNEEKLVEMIRRIVPGQYYGDCFTVYHEQLRHRRQENQIHVLRLFPGYVFISSGEIEQLFSYLKKIPAMSKIMASDDFTFTPLYQREAEFLLDIMDTDHIIRLSYVATDGRDHVTYLSGPLEKCRDQIQSYRFRKRYAAVRLTLDGREKEVKLGIILNNDVRREIAYGKIEAAVRLPEKYSIPLSGDTLSNGALSDDALQSNALANGKTGIASGKKCETGLQTGDKVLVMEGAFEGSVAAVSQVKKDTLKLSVQMFGREMSVEVPAESVKRIG